jgi:hypothetical protein
LEEVLGPAPKPTPRFRTFQVCPKDLPVRLRQAEGAVTRPAARRDREGAGSSMGELRCARSVCLPFVLSAARHCVRRDAGHVTERPHLGLPFARSAAAEVNYSCVQIGHAILRRHRTTGAVQRGNSVTHSVADATRNWCFDSGRPAELNNLRRAYYRQPVDLCYRPGSYRASVDGSHTSPDSPL